MAVKRWNEITSWDDLPQVIGVQHLMRLLRISETTALKYLREGRIPATKACGTWLIDKDAVRDFLRGGNAA